MIFNIVFIALVPLIATALKDSETFEAINAAVIAVENRKHKNFLDDSQVCYEEIGCFSKTGPMKHVGTLPDTPTKINTRFFAYTPEAPTTAYEIHAKHTASHSVVAQAKPLAIIAHGFRDNGQTPDLLTLKASLLKSGHVSTVIITDWEKGAAAPWYAEASVNTQVVGRQIANLVNHLKTSRCIDPAQVHLLGFSLGAHVSGYAGKFSRSEYKWKFGRISAMDAAALLFEGYPGSYLTKEDATFVDAIHTSAGANLLTGEVGFVQPIGHVDFYPNGGAYQPHCAGHISLSCNHGSSVLYMDASLSAATKCKFRAFKCKTWEEYSSGKCADTKGDSRMGYSSVSFPGKGTHYLKTTANYPFC